MSEEKANIDTIAILPGGEEASPRYEDDKDLAQEITPVKDDTKTIVSAAHDMSHVTPEMRRKIADYYGRKAEEDSIAPAADVTMILEKVIEMPEEEAMDIIVGAIEYHRDDPNFPATTMQKIKLLSLGYKVAEMDPHDWAFDIKTEAAVLHYHSPYPEVRSVTDPFDDPDTPVETPRSYFLGMVFMAGATALNTFFSPRQPSISIGANVLQLLLAPCGIFLAKVLPNWTYSLPRRTPLLGGAKLPLNPGPWSFKEQMFATIMFTIANNAGGTYYVYLVQMLPQYLGQTWVTFGYEILLALSVQFFGFGFAGLLRRFVIFPVEAIWPKVLPTLALNRALILPQKKGENINGWTIDRYRFFMIVLRTDVCLVLDPKLSLHRGPSLQLDDLDRAQQLRPRDDYRVLWRHGLQSLVDIRLERRRNKCARHSLLLDCSAIRCSSIVRTRHHRHVLG